MTEPTPRQKAFRRLAAKLYPIVKRYFAWEAAWMLTSIYMNDMTFETQQHLCALDIDSLEDYWMEHYI